MLLYGLISVNICDFSVTVCCLVELYRLVRAYVLIASLNIFDVTICVC